jgi:hypothetical protein
MQQDLGREITTSKNDSNFHFLGNEMDTLGNMLRREAIKRFMLFNFTLYLSFKVYAGIDLTNSISYFSCSR